MNSTSRRAVLSFIVPAIVGLHLTPAQAADAAGAEVHRLQTTWEAIKFGVPEGDEQTKKMNALGEDADAVAARFPDSVEVLIWDGIITSERASMAGVFSALGLARCGRADEPGCALLPRPGFPSRFRRQSQGTAVARAGRQTCANGARCLVLLR
jgi:hypothetical protein